MKIKKMPTKKLLEEFLQSMNGSPSVIFDYEKGEFIRVRNA